MNIYHEAPLSIFKKVQKMTDGDYCLVHLLEESEEYKNAFLDAVKQGRTVILDNSIFELGEAFDGDLFAKWIEILKPTYYIIPDVFNDSQQTINNFNDWVNNYSGLPGKMMAVAQGNTEDEFIECYKYLVDKVDKIAISFCYNFLKHSKISTKHAVYDEFFSIMANRQALLSNMLKRDIINKNKPHHLLGCTLPQEFKAYKNYQWIDSIDTSNPVVAGLMGIKYTEDGLTTKPTQKLFTLINDEINVEQFQCIEYNINKFKTFCGRS